MVWATPTFAAASEASASSAYAKPQPGAPTTHPADPGPGPILTVGPADLKVDYISQAGGNGTYQWTYEVRNIGQTAAQNAKVMKNAIRNDFMGDIESEIEYQQLGTMAPGAVKTVVVSCAPKYQQPPCSTSGVTASTTSVDGNSGNDWDTSPTNYP
jgi:hypothetical protein